MARSMPAMMSIVFRKLPPLTLKRVPHRAAWIGQAWWLLLVSAWLIISTSAPAAGEPALGVNLLKGWRIQDRPANHPAEGRRRGLVIAATSDLHGWIVRDTLFPADRPGGLAHLAPLISNLRREAPGLILLDGGDTLQGAPNLEYAARRDPSSIPLVLRLMNRLGYDSMTLGNHDLEAGQAALARWVGQSAFPWLAANMTNAHGRPVLPPYRIIERGDLRVAVLGLITPGVPIWVDGQHLAGLRFGDMGEAVKRWMPVLRERERADVVVGVFHSGMGGWYDRPVALRHGLPLPNAAGLIADESSGIDLIVSGHAHRLAPLRPSDANSDYAVPVVQPGARGEALAVVRLELRAVLGRWKLTGLSRETQRAAIAPDSALLADVAPLLDDTRAWLAQSTSLQLTAIPAADQFYACAGELSHDAVSHSGPELLSPRERPRPWNSGSLPPGGEAVSTPAGAGDRNSVAGAGDRNSVAGAGDRNSVAGAGARNSAAAEAGTRNTAAGEGMRNSAAAVGAVGATTAPRPFSLLPRLWRFDTTPPSKLPTPLRRAHIHRWMPYANSLVLARLNTRQMALLLDPFARWSSGLRVRNSAVLHPGGMTAHIAPGGTEVLGLSRDQDGAALARHAPQPVWLTNYHWNGGGGLARRALLHPEQLLRRSPVTLRERVFRLLSDPAYSLPAPCRAFLARAK